MYDDITRARKTRAVMVTAGSAVAVYLLAVWIFIDGPVSFSAWPVWLGLALALCFGLLEGWNIVRVELEGMLMHLRWTAGALPRWPTPDSRIFGTPLYFVPLGIFYWFLEFPDKPLLVALGPASACAATMLSMTWMKAAMAEEK